MQLIVFLAYTGPGAGLTMIGSLIAVLCVVLLALVAPIIYLARFVLNLFRGGIATGESDESIETPKGNLQ